MVLYHLDYSVQVVMGFCINYAWTYLSLHFLGISRLMQHLFVEKAVAVQLKSLTVKLMLTFV